MNAPRPARKTHEVVAGQLRDRILSGELQVGDRLPPEDELTEVFGVARTTLREALRVLESQGLITIRRGRGGGPVVTHPSLEPAAMALATRSFRIESFRDPADLVRHIAGGLLMGFGGVTALGCTLGQGVSGLSTLALGAAITTAAIMAGAVATMKLQYSLPTRAG